MKPIGNEFKHTAQELVAEMYDHYKVNQETGMVVQVIGWDNRGDNENLREVLYDAIGIKQEFILKLAKAAGTDLAELVKTFWKTKSIKEAITKATAEKDRLEKYVLTLETLRGRIHEALDLPSADRSKPVWRSGVSDALMEECRRYITVSLLNMDREYTLETPFVRWNENHIYHRVESDFSITEWRVGLSGYKNKISGRDVVGLELTYLLHNFDKDQTLYQACYDPETGNFTRSWNSYSGSGEWTPGSETYHTNLEDALADAKKGIAKLNKKNRAIVKAANEKIEQMVA